MTIALDRRERIPLPVLDHQQRSGLPSLPELMRTQILTDIRQTSEAVLLENLFKGNEHVPRKETPFRATPEGFMYERIAQPYNVVQYTGEKDISGAHPTDADSDFLSWRIFYSPDRSKIRHRLVTPGEAGSDLSPEKTRVIRITEAENSAKFLGLELSFLRRLNGDNFPDGKLMQYLPELIEAEEKFIERVNPDEIYLPSIYLDHPDHKAWQIAKLQAILNKRAQGFYKNRKIFVGMSDPEFGVSIGQEWARREIPVNYGGNMQLRRMYGESINTTYADLVPQYHIDSRTGFVTIDFVPNIDVDEVNFNHNGFSQMQAYPALISLQTYPFAVAPFIIGMTRKMEETKTEALFMHNTQMNGLGYRTLLPTLDEIRGRQVKADYGMALYRVYIPGVTLENALPSDVPKEAIFQLKIS